MKAIVVGAGVIGLSCARALADRGAQVVVLDGSTGSQEASWAAGGILGPGSEHAADSPLFRLSLDALAGWPEALARLRTETRVEVAYDATGTLLVALTPADRAELAARAQFLAGAGLRATLLDGAGARVREPRLAPGVLAALHLAEARLDNRALWTALREACTRHGLDVRIETPVDEVTERGGRVTGVRTGGAALEADAVVLAAGAWSEGLARSSGLVLPTKPVKGQMLRLAAPDGFLKHVVKRGIAYSVPHRGHGLVTGTTAEDVGFHRGVDPAALDRMVADAAALVPEVAGLPRAEAWAGFRPRLADGLPALGRVPSRPGLFVATGHFRNGILLADVSGRLVADAVFGRDDPRLAAFSPERFGAPARKA